MKPLAPTLVLGVGNPSRGDDALGPMAIDRLAAALTCEVEQEAIELLTDFQLQIEHALDLRQRHCVIFVDASASGPSPFSFTRAVPERDHTISTHAMSPQAVLETYRITIGQPPEAWVLAIRGEHFELGEALSAVARQRLDLAVGHLLAELRQGRRFTVEGIVQGVGFRPWVQRTATALGLGGRVWNTGRDVAIEAFGTRAALDSLVEKMSATPPPAAQVESATWVEVPAQPVFSFSIAPSAAAMQTRLTLPPDIATCDACLGDVANASDRHYRYPLASCADCGPRFSITLHLPYDRANTSMAAFSPCPACRESYDCVDDRRFHAQTIACPACGPTVWLADRSGQRIDVDDPIAAASARLVAGAILGVQGLGAFHLVCDATSVTSVTELRRRKQRDQQPFAVMVHDQAAAEAIAILDDDARAALRSSARPIVLVPSQPEALPIAVSGPSRRTGVMLPYTPLHHRLTSLVQRPLVVTSGNPSGGPAIIEAAEATAVLGPMVDAFLFHDRPIVRRVEDSVVARGRVIRRSRGLSPLPLRLPVPAPQPILAVGAHMKSTVCVVVDDRAYVGPHLGDLGSVEADRAFARDVDSFERLLGVHSLVVAHDLHPEYGSTRYALSREPARRIGVQHHVAHALAALAEHRVLGPALGIVFDGTGLGTDGALWGAELLRIEGCRWSRHQTFRSLALPGGERAIREP